MTLSEVLMFFSEDCPLEIKVEHKGTYCFSDNPVVQNAFDFSNISDHFEKQVKDVKFTKDKVKILVG